MKRRIFLNAVLLTVICLFANAQAALIGILPATPSGTDYQAYYDDILDITWVANATINGAGTWQEQMAWAESLTLGGVGGWRLPTPDGDADGTIEFCNAAGTNADCILNELDHLYTVYGVTQANPEPFTGMPEFPAQFWTSFENPNDPDSAWFFGFGNGNQTYADKELVARFAWAVHDGNVALIPIPAAVWLFGSALVLLGWMQTRVT